VVLCLDIFEVGISAHKIGHMAYLKAGAIKG